jgi:DNA-binding GntR family transcriptional regulator
VRLPPRAAEVAGAVADAIEAGELKPGQAAPSAKTLHAETGVAYDYCLIALKSLEEDELLAREGRGWTVREPGRS